MMTAAQVTTVSPNLRATAIAWLLRQRAALGRRLLISEHIMPDRIRFRLDAEIERLDAALADITGRTKENEP